MNYKAFVEEQIASIKGAVGNGIAINALSGGVDSSVVTVLGHRAIGDRLRTVFIDNALMRQDEPRRVAEAVGIAERHGWSPVAASQMEYSLVERAVETEMMARAWRSPTRPRARRRCARCPSTI